MDRDKQNIHHLTHEDMKNHFLSGDRIDETTTAEQGDYELDRQVGGDQIDERTDALIKVPTEDFPI